MRKQRKEEKDGEKRIHTRRRSRRRWSSL